MEAYYISPGRYKPIEAFKLDLEESPPEATDERCKNVETHGSEAILESMNPWTLKATYVEPHYILAGQAKDNTWLTVSGNAQMVHLGNMDGNDIDAQRRILYVSTAYVNLTASDPTLLGFYRPNCRSKKLDALNNAYRGCELSTSLYWMVFVHLYSLSHVKPIRLALPSI
ncbi:hypothetical protein Tco_0673661 [Tanacetum coccineum]